MILTFGDFELDEARFELRRAGQPVAVQPKVLRLLFLLASQHERALADDEIMRAVWPNENVGRPSIKRAVLGARAAIDDRNQTAIRTVRGHGYQFTLPVTRRMPPSAHHEALEQAPTSSFVGRDGIMAELKLSLARAHAGQGQCILILGQPGVGKTQLLQELRTRAISGGARVWLGRCMEADGAPPFWPLQQVLREALAGHDAQALHALLGASAADIAEGFPELKASLGHVPTARGGDASAARFRLFDSTAQLLIRAAQEQPALMLLDDLQRADQPTLRFLRFLAGQLANTRLLIVGTVRTGDGKDPYTHELLTELMRESTSTIALEGLSRAEVAHYLQRKTGAVAPGQIADELWEQTGGSPLFLEEILRTARAGNLMPSPSGPLEAWNNLTQLGPTLGLQGAIERHLSTLGHACRALLTSAAVLGREFSLGMLMQLLDEPHEQVVATLAEAMTAGVLQTVVGAVGSYRFTHALIRDALDARSDPLLRAQRHARAAQALEARGAAFADDARLAQLAEHYRLAAPTHDHGRGLFYARRAAERALQRLAYEDAAVHFQRALELLDLAAPDATQRMELLLAKGEALSLGSDFAAARAPLLQAVALARVLHVTPVLAQAARLLGLPRESGTFDKLHVEVLREALAALPEDDPKVPCLMAMLAKRLAYASDPSEGTQLALRALVLANQQCDAVLRSEALLAVHEALSDPAYLETRANISYDLRQLAQRHGDPRVLLSALTSHFQNALERGDPAGLELVLTELDGLAQQARDPLVRCYQLSYRATRAFLDGDLAESEQRAREARHIARVLVGEEGAHHFFCAQMTGILRIQGRLDEAEAMVRDVSARFPALIGWRALFASLQAELGRGALAREILAQLLDSELTRIRQDPYLLSTLCPLAELCARVGDERTAKLLYAELLPYADLHGSVSIGASSYGPITLQLARLAMRMHDLVAAEQHCLHALRAAEHLSSATFIAITCTSYAHCLLLAGPSRAADATLQLQRAHDLAREHQLHALVAACEHMARPHRA